MKKVLVTAAITTLAVVPAGASAKPTKTDRSTAAQECNLERGSTAATREAFLVRYGKGRKRKNAFKRCVARRARSEERQQGASQTNAAQECRAERARNPLLFAQTYGTNVKYPNPYNNNAFGKCVSQHAHAKKVAADTRDIAQILVRRNAAAACAAERRRIGRTDFAQKYGKGRSKRRNAFGKCVSATAKARSQS